VCAGQYLNEDDNDIDFRRFGTREIRKYIYSRVAKAIVVAQNKAPFVYRGDEDISLPMCGLFGRRTVSETSLDPMTIT
jgi:hypothetical protein